VTGEGKAPEFRRNFPGPRSLIPIPPRIPHPASPTRIPPPACPMPDSEYALVGLIRKAQGIRGEVIVEPL